MLDYEKLYRILFNGITDALCNLENEDDVSARETLIRAQQTAEDYYICADEEDGNGADSIITAARTMPYLYAPSPFSRSEKKRD